MARQTRTTRTFPTVMTGGLISTAASQFQPDDDMNICASCLLFSKMSSKKEILLLIFTPRGSSDNTEEWPATKAIGDLLSSLSPSLSSCLS